MKRTISIKLLLTEDQGQALFGLQQAFANSCNAIVPFAVEHRCWNQVALHHLTYYPIREQSHLGSQMVCNSIKAVCNAYRALKPQKGKEVPVISFKPNGSIHFDKRTYSIKDKVVSLYTLAGRAKIKMQPGAFQKAYLEQGTPKEAELVFRGGKWFFNLVLELPDRPPTRGDLTLGVDLGENNMATTSSGKILGGGQLRHNRDRYLALRRRLQSNGSQSAKQLLKRISGKEQRHIKHLNHEVSKAIVSEALRCGASTIVMEDLTNIRQRIQAGKRMRSRLHRWAWAQLQGFVQYKAEAAGLRVAYVNPAYSSQTCSVCGCLGRRVKHRFFCSHCGSQQHSDLNASQNLCRLAMSADVATGAVNRPYVAGYA